MDKENKHPVKQSKKGQCLSFLFEKHPEHCPYNRADRLQLDKWRSYKQHRKHKQYKCSKCDSLITSSIHTISAKEVELQLGFTYEKACCILSAIRSILEPTSDELLGLVPTVRTDIICKSVRQVPETGDAYKNLSKRSTVTHVVKYGFMTKKKWYKKRASEVHRFLDAIVYGGLRYNAMKPSKLARCGFMVDSMRQLEDSRWMSLFTLSERIKRADEIGKCQWARRGEFTNFLLMEAQ